MNISKAYDEEFPARSNKQQRERATQKNGILSYTKEAVEYLRKKKYFWFLCL